jgi:hypothetical protein
MELTWDQVGERTYETGVDRGVLYLPNNAGEYIEGYAWNGLTTVTESPSGAESNPQFADNIKYLNLVSAEEFGATIEAFTYPDEFGQCDGTAEPQPGVYLGQQGRRVFGLAYRTRKGNDIQGTDFGYKIHLVYGALAAPSEKAYSTINDSPEAITFSWEVSTTPVPVNTGDLKPTSLLVIDSTQVAADDLAALEAILYGTEVDDPRLPSPDEIIQLVGSGVINVDLTRPANQPSFVAATGVITLPNVTGVQWSVDGEDVAAGAQPALALDEQATVEARALEGYNLQGDEDWTFRRDAV